MLWAAGVGLAAYAFGGEAARLTGRMSWIFLVVAAVGAVAGVLFVRKHERRLANEAERELPGPIDELG